MTSATGLFTDKQGSSSESTTHSTVTNLTIEKTKVIRHNSLSSSDSGTTSSNSNSNQLQSLEFTGKDLQAAEQELQKQRTKAKYITPSVSEEGANVLNPNIVQLRNETIGIFTNVSDEFRELAQNTLLSNPIITEQQTKALQTKYQEMVMIAKRLVAFAMLAIEDPSSKSPGGGIFKKQSKPTDFFFAFKQAVLKNPFFEKMDKAMDKANEKLMKILLINFDGLTTEKKLSYLIDVESIHANQNTHVATEPIDPLKFVPEHSKKKEKLDFFDKKDIPGSLAFLKKEYHVLSAYRLTLITLAANLKFFGLFHNFQANATQKGLFDKIVPVMKELLNEFTKVDNEEFELKKAIPLALNSTQSITYSVLLYNALALAITTHLIETYINKAHILLIQHITQKYSNSLKLASKPHAFFCDECISAFQESLRTQKNDREFLEWWYRLIGGGLLNFVDEKDEFILPARLIAAPKQPDSSSKNYEAEMIEYRKNHQNYLENLAGYVGEGIPIFSKYLLQDEPLLSDFLLATAKIIQKYRPHLATARDVLTAHSNNFTFLEFLNTDKTQETKTILRDYEVVLKEKHAASLQYLLQSSNGKYKSGVEVVINSLLRIYRLMNHKYIMEAKEKLQQLYNELYPNDRNIIQDIPENENSQTRAVFVKMKRSHYEILSERKDRVSISRTAKETYCYFYTNTLAKDPYPGEEELKITHEIHFAYQYVDTFDVNSTQYKIIPPEIKAELQERIRRLNLFIQSLGYPPFKEKVERNSK